MVQWEYKVVALAKQVFVTMGRYGDNSAAEGSERTAAVYEAQLALLGDEGWELVGVWGPEVALPAPAAMLILKRPKEAA